MRIRCRFGWHLWTRWSDAIQRNYVSVPQTTWDLTMLETFKVKPPTYSRWTQDRQCESCGAARRRVL